MSAPISLDDFKPLQAELFQQLIQQDWFIAGKLAVDCQSFVNEALAMNQPEVALAARELLDALVDPFKDQGLQETADYGVLREKAEMTRFILRHLELKPSHALKLVDHLTTGNAQHVVDGIIRRGVLERTNDGDLPPRHPDKSWACVKLVHTLLDKGLLEPAASLIEALPYAKGLVSSDFFVDALYVKAILRLGHTEVDFKRVLSRIEEPLGELTSMMRNLMKNGQPLFAPALLFTPPPLEDLFALSELGATALARKLFITGDYISKPVVLTDVAVALGGAFTRKEMIEMGNYRVNFRGDTTVWFSNALIYWIDNPGTPWPFLNKLDEGDSAIERISKSPLAYSRNKKQGLQGHVHALAHTYQSKPFESDEERLRIMRRAAVLYMEGYWDDDLVKLCTEVMREDLPRMLQVGVFQDKDLEMAIDLGL